MTPRRLAVKALIHQEQAGYANLVLDAELKKCDPPMNTRDAAFAACDYVMDFLKTRAPFWKKEHPADRSEGGWVEAKAQDDARAERWKGR